MTIDFATLLSDLRDRAPIGVELPRDPDDNSINETVIEGWVDDAAQMINNRRGKTTLKETTITTTAGTAEYDLPSGCREVVAIRREHISPASTYEVLGVPPGGLPALSHGSFGFLPSGQEVDMALDVIQRTRMQRHRREDEYEFIGGQIRFLFATVDDEQIVVRYREPDRRLLSVPDDRYELIMTYLMYKALDRHLSKHSVQIAADGGDFIQGDMSMMLRLKMEHQSTWNSGLNAIGPEVD
jgi:hypothetical protein